MITANNQENKTSDFNFDESKFKIKSRRLMGEPEVPAFVKLLVKSKFAKTENQALLIITCLIVIFLGLSVFLIRETVSIEPAKISPGIISEI